VQVVVVREQERQLRAIYEVRKHILGHNEPPPVCSDYDLLNANGIDLRGKSNLRIVLEATKTKTRKNLSIFFENFLGKLIQ
jgi:hypothetical protein